MVTKMHICSPLNRMRGCRALSYHGVAEASLERRKPNVPGRDGPSGDSGLNPRWRSPTKVSFGGNTNTADVTGVVQSKQFYKGPEEHKGRKAI